MRLSSIYAWPARHRAAMDVTCALVLWVFTVAAAGSVYSLPETMLASAEVLPLAFRRSHPVPSAATITVAGGIHVLLGVSLMPGSVGVLIAVYSLAAWGRARYARAGALGMAVAAGVLGGLRTMPMGRQGGLDQLVPVFGLTLVAVVSWLAGDLMRNRRMVAHRLAEQNEALRRDRDQRVQLAQQQERTRIAREMHDIVAHNLAVIVVQADGASYAAAHDTGFGRDDSRAALEAIGHTARDALRETRQLVGVLREEHQVDFAPTSGLADVGELLATMRAANRSIRLDVRGSAVALPRDVDLAAFRVVQEALTNVLKHAGPAAQTAVTLAYGPRQLDVTVEDDGIGAGAGDDGSGNGLVGMRERVTAAGGRLVTGARPGGGFQVWARLPAVAGLEVGDEPARVTRDD